MSEIAIFCFVIGIFVGRIFRSAPVIQSDRKSALDSVNWNPGSVNAVAPLGGSIIDPTYNGGSPKDAISTNENGVMVIESGRLKSTPARNKTTTL